MFCSCQTSAQPWGLQNSLGISALAPKLSQERLSGLWGLWCCSDPSPGAAPPGSRCQQRPAGASPEPPRGPGGAGAGWGLPGPGDPPAGPVGTRPPPQQRRGTGPFAGSARVGPSARGSAGAAQEGQGGPARAAPPPSRPLQPIPALPQPRSPRPAGAPAANPAAPRAVAERGGSPGSRGTEEGGDLGAAGRSGKDSESVTASALGGSHTPHPRSLHFGAQGGDASPSPALCGATGSGASRLSVPGQEGEQRQQPEEAPAPGALREPLIQVNAPSPAPRLGWVSGGRVSGGLGSQKALETLRPPPEALCPALAGKMSVRWWMCVQPPGAAPCVHG